MYSSVEIIYQSRPDNQTSVEEKNTPKEAICSRINAAYCLVVRKFGKVPSFQMEVGIVGEDVLVMVLGLEGFWDRHLDS